MRKIKRYEIKKVSEVFAKIFNEYKAYDLFFEKDSHRERKMALFFRYEIFASQNYTYVYDDFSALAAVKKPSDKDINPKYLFCNPFFTLPFYFIISYNARKLASTYLEFADKVAEKYYNPEKDCYIKNIGVCEEFRRQGKLKEMISNLCMDLPVYLETHEFENVKIYRKMGFEICEETEFCGFPFYAMRRE